MIPLSHEITFAYFGNINTLVTQPMSQLRPNRTELRSMDLSDQILCRFQKYKRKVPPPSLPPSKKKKHRLKAHVYGSKFFFSRNISFPSSKQKLFSFLHIGNTKIKKKQFWKLFLIFPKKTEQLLLGWRKKFIPGKKNLLP